MDKSKPRDFHNDILVVLRLTRWDEHVLFTVPATLLGVVVALNISPAVVDWRVGVVLVANVLAVAFAFMVNDIEDARDDARDPVRQERNVIAAGRLSSRTGWWLSWGVATASLSSFALVNPRVLTIGVLTIAVSWLYSWRTVRLKALPAVDVLAHVLMLSALLFLAGYAAYTRQWMQAGSTAVGVSLISAYGQLYNQLRDYTLDRAAGLHNTASLLGPRGTQWAMHGALVAAGCSLMLAVVTDRIPLGLVALVVALSPLALMFRSAQDMRGSTALDASGQLQMAVMVIATVAIVVWLLVFMLS